MDRSSQARGKIQQASKQRLFVTWQHKLGSGPLVCSCEMVLQKHAEAAWGG